MVIILRFEQNDFNSTQSSDKLCFQGISSR